MKLNAVNANKNEKLLVIPLLASIKARLNTFKRVHIIINEYFFFFRILLIELNKLVIE